MNKPVLTRSFNLNEDVLSLLRLRQKLGGDDTEASLRAQLDWQNQTPGQDRFVAESVDNPGELLGQSFGFHTIPERYLAWVEVHPDHRRRRLGRELLAHSIKRARAVGADHMLVNANANDAPASAFLISQGFWPKSDAWFMHAPADIALPDPEWPSGYRVRSFAQVQDVDLVATTYYKCYGDMWGHGANSKALAATSNFKEGWQEFWLSPQDPNGESIFLVFGPNDEAIGLGHGEIGTVEGQKDFAEHPKLHVDGPGIALSHRQRGLQRPLLLTVMRWLRARSADAHSAFSLSSYGDAAATVDVYRDLGFQLDTHLVAYHLDLAA